MDKIASFTVNHLDLIPGVYVSRKDYVGKEVLTTFDLRMTCYEHCRTSYNRTSGRNLFKK